MVISSNTFRSQLSQRLDELGDHMEKLLAPFVEVGPNSIKRFQRLRRIIDSAAYLAVDCELQPSKPGMIWFGSGNDCQQDQMCDVLGETADRKLASGGAFVGLTVSPMVFRDKKTVLVKARVLRQLPAEELRMEAASEVSCRRHGYRR